jgi:hypothetical protein
MRIMKVDPRALKENPDRMRQSKSSPQAEHEILYEQDELEGNDVPSSMRFENPRASTPIASS